MRWSKASQKFPMVSWFKYFCQLASSYTFQIYGLSQIKKVSLSFKTLNTSHNDSLFLQQKLLTSILDSNLTRLKLIQSRKYKK